MLYSEKSSRLPVSRTTKESCARIMKSLLQHTFLEHLQPNTNVPFSEKQAIYLSALERNIHSRNHRYVLECKGEDE